MTTIVKVHNDGKQKHQSFEAWIDDVDCPRGYGATEEEAISNYNDILVDYCDQITHLRNNVLLDEFKKVPVDYAGNEL